MNRNRWLRSTAFVILILSAVAATTEGGEQKILGIEERRDLEAQSSRIADYQSRGVSVKIVGGEEVKPPGKYPWMVALAFPVFGGGLYQYCGGSLISNKHVLTAAHCKVQLGDRVIVGRHDLTTSEGRTVKVRGVVNHPAYDGTTKDSDIAVVILEDTVEVSPISLLQSDVGLEPGMRSTTVGWGSTSSGGNGSDVLREAPVPLVSREDCAKAYQPSPITDNMLCAGDGGKDSCQGDSGGPLFVQNGGAPSLVGIVSFGKGCADPKYPGVYTRAAKFAPWVAATTGS